MKQAELFEHQNSVIAKLRCNILKEDDIIKQISMQSKKSKNDKETTGKSVQIISRSRIAILGKLSSVPIFSGHGQFGSVSVVK